MSLYKEVHMTYDELYFATIASYTVMRRMRNMEFNLCTELGTNRGTVVKRSGEFGKAL